MLMKKKSLLLLALLMGSLFIFSSCESDEEKGEQAAYDFCECIKHRSLSKCNEELNDDYKPYFSDDFKTGFDRISKRTCGYEFQLIRY